MDSFELHAWSRHYDIVLWTVTGILTGGNVALAVYALNADKVHWAIPAVGIIVTMLTVYFASSFRSARLHIHNRLPKEELEIVRGCPTLKQWGPVIAFLMLVHFLWIGFLWFRYPVHRFIWILLGIVIALVIVVTAWMADHPRPQGRGDG